MTLHRHPSRAQVFALIATVGAVAVGVLGASSWWADVLAGGGLMLMPIEFTLPVFLVGAALLGFLARHIGIKRSDRFYDAKVLEVFSAQRSLLIEVIPERGARCTLRILNIGPQKWRIHEVFWSSYTIDGINHSAPRQVYPLDFDLHPYVRWQAQYELPSAGNFLALNKGSISVSVSVPGNPERSIEKAICGAATVWFPREIKLEAPPPTGNGAPKE